MGLRDHTHRLTHLVGKPYIIFIHKRRWLVDLVRGGGRSGGKGGVDPGENLDDISLYST